MGMAHGHRLAGGGADVFGRVKVGLAERKVEDFDPLRLQLAGFGPGGERGRGDDPGGDL